MLHNIAELFRNILHCGGFVRQFPLPLDSGKDLVLHLRLQLGDIPVVPVESGTVDSSLLTDLGRRNIAEGFLLEQPDKSCR